MRRSLVSLVVLLLVSPALWSAERAVQARNGMVVSVSAPGSEVGVAILKKGGNAVDAAVATAFALAVTHPAAGNIGGGGFMLVYPGPGQAPVMIDYRETAPAAASKTIYTRKDSVYGHKVVGVPGTVHGMALAHQKYGKLKWRDVVMPAVQLADDGFVIDAYLARSLNNIVAGSKSFPELRRVFAKADAMANWEEGDRLVQKDLAKTLRLIAEQGPDAFYSGPIAELLVAEIQSGGGLITREDLARYQAKVRVPIKGSYRGHDVYGPASPSSGGITLTLMLNILENFDLKKQGKHSPETIHLMVEAMRRAYCDRARHLGDPDFTKIPGHLTTKEYARMLAQQIDLKKATRSEELAKDIALAAEGDSTTHFSVIDKDGMAVANTYTLEHSYGCRVVVKGAGFLLNNEMADFNWFPGHTDRTGRIGTDPNLIAPGKRMLSSQTPCLVVKDGKLLLVTGSPGGRTIINTTLNVVLNVIDFDMDVQSAVSAPRLHHQWFPDQVRFEGLNAHPDAVAKLRAMGHLVISTKQGDAHSIWIDPRTGVYHGAADQRISGHAAGY